MTADPDICLIFDFLEKGLGIVPLPHFMHDFLRKNFLMLNSINWPNFIVWLPFLRETLGNMCVAIVCFPDCDVINFEINLIHLIKPFSYMTKTSRQKFKYLEKRAFKLKQKAIFITFKELSVAKNCLRLESAPLTPLNIDQTYHQLVSPFFRCCSMVVSKFNWAIISNSV